MRVRGRKPTYEERKILLRNELNTYDWLVTKSTPTFLELVNRKTSEVIQITK